MEIIDIVLSVIGFLLASLIGIIVYLYKDMKDKQSKTEAEMGKMKSNYLTRFDTLNRSITDVEKNIISEFSKLVAEIAKTRHDTREELWKLQNRTTDKFQDKANCLVHGEELKELREEVREIKSILMAR